MILQTVLLCLTLHLDLVLSLDLGLRDPDITGFAISFVAMCYYDRVHLQVRNVLDIGLKTCNELWQRMLN